MDPKPVFLDFLNREAARAIGRERDEDTDLEIIRILTVALPYRFSANISQITEYGNARPRLFSELIKLINAKVIDATSTSATLDEFIADRQARYSHVPDRYPFYFKHSDVLESVRLGSRNSFSMTDDLSRIISGYSVSMRREPRLCSLDVGFLHRLPLPRQQFWKPRDRQV